MTLPAFPTPAGFHGGRKVRVRVVGAGGNGSMLLDALARLDCAIRAQGHPGMETEVYDADTVSISNVGRQRFTARDVGFNKAVLMVHRLNAFYGLDWNAVPKFMDPRENVRSLDLIVGCVDRGSFRHALGKANAGKHSETLYLDTGNGDSTGQVVLGHLGKPQAGLRLPNVYDLFGTQLLDGDEDDQPSCSLAEALTRQRWSMNPLIATVAASLLDKLFHKGGLDEHGALIRLDRLSVTPMLVDEAIWSTYGYNAAKAAKTAKAA